MPAVTPPFQGLIFGVGAPALSKPAGVLYSRQDQAGLYASTPTPNPAAIVQHGSNQDFSEPGANLPGNPTLGNLLIGFFSCTDDPSAHLNVADWTVITNGGALFTYAMYRYVQPGDVAALPLMAGNFTHFGAMVYEITGVTGLIADDVKDSVGTYDQNATFNTTAHNASVAEELFLLFSANWNAAGDITNPAGWTNDIQVGGGAIAWGLLGSHDVFAAAGDSVQANIVLPAASDCGTIQIGLGANSAPTPGWTLIGP